MIEGCRLAQFSTLADYKYRVSLWLQKGNYSDAIPEIQYNRRQNYFLESYRMLQKVLFDAYGKELLDPHGSEHPSLEKLNAAVSVLQQVIGIIKTYGMSLHNPERPYIKFPYELWRWVLCSNAKGEKFTEEISQDNLHFINSFE
jgi:hypothetical protein